MLHWKWFNNSLSGIHYQFLKKPHANTPANESLFINLLHYPQVDNYWKSSLKLSSENFVIEIFHPIMTCFSESMRLTFEFR